MNPPLSELQTLRGELEHLSACNPVAAQRLSQVVLLLETAEELRAKARLLLDSVRVVAPDRRADGRCRV